MQQHICLMNDSFPPQIDGVANTVVNYATYLNKNHGKASVMVPAHPDADDSTFPFDVLRYPSLDLRKLVGYMAGTPFSPEITAYFAKHPVDLLHTHCPIASTILARSIRHIVQAPVVLTYHTKFDIDIAKAVRGKLLQESAIRALVQNINACDEVWVVSKGAGENLRSLGYEGDYIVMPNGVDMPRGRVEKQEIEFAAGEYDLASKVPVFLFVGRMMWYKGIRIILDALAILKSKGISFRMIFIGNGTDLDDIRSYTEKLRLSDCCSFTGAIYDREVIRAWYCRADLFLFPSTFDTNGLVVREAAACGLPSLLVRGSCAAEDVTEDRNGFLIDENSTSMTAKIMEILEHPRKLKYVGQNAMKELYVSWEDAVSHANERYQIVMDRYRCGGYPARNTLSDDFLRSTGAMMETLSFIEYHEEQLRRDAHRIITLNHNALEQRRAQLEQRLRDERKIAELLLLEERKRTEERAMQAYEDFWERYR